MYFENKETSTESKLKSTYESIKAFINNETTIKGYTFKDLTDKTKEKILNLYYELDNKIEEKYPNYKEKVKEKTIKLKDEAKDKYNETKEKVNNYIDSKIDQETQDEIKNSFKQGAEDLKESTIKAKDLIKDILKGE